MAAPPAPDAPPADVAARLAQLRARFMAGLPARLAEIHGATDAAQRHAALHRLCGAAGSFGCTELGRLAREALAACDAAEAVREAAALRALEAEAHGLLHGHNPATVAAPPAVPMPPRTN